MHYATAKSTMLHSYTSMCSAMVGEAVCSLYNLLSCAQMQDPGGLSFAVELAGGCPAIMITTVLASLWMRNVKRGTTPG